MASKLLWLTNIPTPYRVPLWLALRELTNLSVVALAESEPNRDWDAQALVLQANATVVHAPRVSRSPEVTLYGPNIKLWKQLPGRDGALVIDGWESPAYLFAFLIAWRRGSSVVLSYRGTLSSQGHSTGPVARVRAGLFTRAGCILTGGPASTAAVLHMGVPKSKIVEGINVVDVAAIAAAVPRLREPFADGHVFLAVGQLVERKNIAGLITAFAQMRDVEDTLQLVGSGPLETQLREQVVSLGLESLVTFHGHLEGDALVAAYANAHTLVLSSTQEVYGLVVPEALAAGCHAVISSKAGCSDSLGEMQGVFVANPDAVSLATAMRASRSAWSGPIENPEILAHTPEAAAAKVMEAVAVASR